MAAVSKWEHLVLTTAAVVAVLATGSQVALGKKGVSCATIQKSINRLPPAGGEVALRARTYTCTQPIVIDRDNVCLRGQGPSTVLRLADKADAPVLVLGQTLPTPVETRRNICVSDLVIDGNRLNQDHECWGGDCATNPIRNNGITLRRVEEVRIERVTVFGARSGGLVSELGSRHITVRDFTSFDNHFDGLAAYETENSIFSGLHLYNNCAAGLSFDIRFNNNLVDNVVISRDAGINCDPLPRGTVGVFMRDSRANVLSSMQIQNMREHGIFLAQVDSDPTTPAAGNIFTGITVSESGGAALRVNDPSCVDNAVCPSQFIGNNGGCISEATPGLVHGCDMICR